MELLRDMTFFVEVARAGSFTKAAERLGLPTSTLSRRIQALEKNLKLKLMLRTTRSVELTEAGTIYLKRCADIVDAARIAHENIRDLANVPRGHLRVSLTGDFGPIFIAPYLAAFRTAYPEITFDLDMTPHRVNLATEPFDLALRIGALEDSSLVARRLALLKVALYAAPSYLAIRGLPDRPEDLASHDAIPTRRGINGAHWNLSDGKEVRRIALNCPIIANSLGMIRMLVISGAGVGMLDEAMVSQDVKQGRLVRVLPRWSLDRIPINAVTASRLMPEKTRVFVEFLAERLAHLNLA
jgi:DNA-binding transcriptional LysR family regulator